MAVASPVARAFYEAEAIRGGWSVRQLDRQISTRFYERAARAKDPAGVLARGRKAERGDLVTLEDEVRDPYLLEFLDLKDEYSENDLEEALIRHLEWFLLELGNGFTFVARQKRIRIGDEWYRMDLLLYHRRLKSLVVIDLKKGQWLSCLGSHGTKSSRCARMGEVRQLKQPWSVLAYQLAGDPGLELLHADGKAEERDSAPPENLLTILLEMPVRDGLGVLILVDEVLMYAREKAAMDPAWKDRLINFFQYLTQAVTKVDRCCMVASLLASEPVKGDAFGRQLQGQLYDIFQRQREEAVEPVVKEDVAEVLRRRFFTPESLQDTAAFRAHVQAALNGLCSSERPCWQSTLTTPELRAGRTVRHGAILPRRRGARAT